MKINIERLMADIENFAKYGSQPDGGVSRTCFSKADFEVRQIFADQLKELGMDLEIDAAANIWGTFEGDGTKNKPILIGSHLDTVPNGGKFDGALGVLTGKEIVRTLLDHKQRLHHPLKIVSFTAEEANDFNFATLGSRALAGKISAADLSKAENSEGIKLTDAIKRAGGNLNKISPAENNSFAAFFELHIEQGRKLEKEGLPLGIVDRIVGIYRDAVIVTGEQNHSGTTMMSERSDALAAAGEMAAAVQKAAKALQTDAVATVGKFDVFPNSANIIPGKVEFILEVRSADKLERESLAKSIRQSFESIATNYNVSVSAQNFYDTQECEFDRKLIDLLKQAADASDTPYSVMPSMAGHDAMHIATLGKAAMVFVKSIGGISHNPAELSLPEDIEQSANVLLQAILLADKNL
ncbi:Zn-dependent hydrolase [Planococcus sp. FY231025]|uniref:Zn-dependent hydrolase n=1 Tax=Planococcus sp. FY231025 TaxID=3455699 RepID=UPI003F8F890F